MLAFRALAIPLGKIVLESLTGEHVAALDDDGILPVLASQRAAKSVFHDLLANIARLDRGHGAHPLQLALGLLALLFGALLGHHSILALLAEPHVALLELGDLGLERLLVGLEARPLRPERFVFLHDHSEACLGFLSGLFGAAGKLKVYFAFALESPVLRVRRVPELTLRLVLLRGQLDLVAHLVDLLVHLQHFGAPVASLRLLLLDICEQSLVALLGHLEHFRDVFQLENERFGLGLGAFDLLLHRGYFRLENGTRSCLVVLICPFDVLFELLAKLIGQR
mmetsp:Transcript_1629/g.5027  ORF Transcript_1629/g.5027 Transcript_1629/m.5027 type:complete len:281 (-) Transcript_1629:193-1035(-)